MADDFVEVISYLKLSELQSLENLLNAEKIKYNVNGHGAASRYHSQYYGVSVLRKDYKKANEIANKFRVSNFIKGRQCPKCKSPLYEPVTKLNFLQEILYAGTTPVRCKKCGTKFVI
jgi:RNase P subunit RPR2